jgi:hypothetical protein
MGQGEVANAVADSGGADDVRERSEWSEKRPDRQRSEEEDDFGPEDADQLIEPFAAVGLLLGRGDPVAPGSRQAAGVAARDRGEVDPRIEVGLRDARFLEPGPELVPGDAREWPVLDRGAQPWRLADQQDPRDWRIGIGIASDRDGFALVEKAGQMALAAGAEAGVERNDSGAAPGLGGRSAGHQVARLWRLEGRIADHP